MEQYSPEIVAILGVGVAVLAVGVAAVAGSILQQGRRLDSRIDALAVRTDDRFRQMAEQMTKQDRRTDDRFRLARGVRHR